MYYLGSCRSAQSQESLRFLSWLVWEPTLWKALIKSINYQFTDNIIEFAKPAHLHAVVFMCKGEQTSGWNEVEGVEEMKNRGGAFGIELELFEGETLEMAVVAERVTVFVIMSTKVFIGARLDEVEGLSSELEPSIWISVSKKATFVNFTLLRGIGRVVWNPHGISSNPSMGVGWETLQQTLWSLYKCVHWKVEEREMKRADVREWLVEQQVLHRPL